jgi:hypothetical protein
LNVCQVAERISELTGIAYDVVVGSLGEDETSLVRRKPNGSMRSRK